MPVVTESLPFWWAKFLRTAEVAPPDKIVYRHRAAKLVKLRHGVWQVISFHRRHEGFHSSIRAAVAHCDALGDTLR